MRAITIGLLVVILTAVLVTTGSHFNVVTPAKANQGCSLKTLNGNYGGVWTGYIDSGAPPVNPQTVGNFIPYDGLEVSTWDGAGNFTASDVFTVGGTPGQPANDSGVYTVNSDCTGTLTLTNGLTFDFIIFGGGKEIRFAETDGLPTVVIETRIEP